MDKKEDLNRHKKHESIILVPVIVILITIGTVAFGAAFDFSVAVDPSSAFIVKGQSAATTVSVNLLSGTTKPVTLKSSGCPTKATCSFTKSKENAPYSSIFTVNTTSSIKAGNYKITITGTGGSKIRKAIFRVNVTEPQPVFDFSITKNRDIIVTQGASGSSLITVNLISGVSEPVTLSVSGLPADATSSFTASAGYPTFSSTLDIVTSLTTQPGIYNLIVTGVGGNITHIVQLVLVMNAPSSGNNTMWIPPQISPWQWQLTGTVDQSVNVPIYDIDLFDNDASVVSSLHAQGRKVICYISAGSYENWRPDAYLFPSSVLGRNNGWAGEKWLDIRQIDILGPIMEARMDLCKAKGFDAVEPDNIDGYTNPTGFPLTYQDQINYNRFLANAAHARGLSIGLKNDIEQVNDLLPDFDWALNEQCFQYDECDTLLPFINAGKAVFQTEYSLSTSSFCPSANAMKFNSMKKNLDLDA